MAKGLVVALTLRYDRIDAFWFMLMHELAHLAEGRREASLDQLEDGGAAEAEPAPADPHEEAANQLASCWLLAPDAFAEFVARTGPRFSLFAGRTGVVIAHRLRTVQRADDILIPEAGRVVKQGPRARLAADPTSRFSSLLRPGLEEALA